MEFLIIVFLIIFLVVILGFFIANLFDKIKETNDRITAMREYDIARLRTQSIFVEGLNDRRWTKLCEYLNIEEKHIPEIKKLVRVKKNKEELKDGNHTCCDCHD